MSTEWLRKVLDETTSAATDGGDPVLTVAFHGGEERVYCPDSSEYHVDCDVVEKARDLGASIIAYSNTWSGATVEAKAYGKAHGLTVIPYAQFFAYLKRKGVTFAN